MQNRQIIRGERIGEQYTRVEHPSGLTMLLYPMEGFSTAYAMFSTKYGSVDSCFRIAGEQEFTQVPDGIAHYLEHKMFESEDGDAFARYAQTGASANAFTSFEKTSYLFACSDHFRESIEILLDFVTHPYFTPETVEKEQGIIAQEIRMYDDSPEWRVMFNLLESLYHHNPVKLDIAGTVESISQIDAGLLYRCYHTFYNLHNMVLTVAGNFREEEVLEAADQVLKTAAPFQVERKATAEPREVVRSRVEQTLPVAVPLFEIGFKSRDEGENKNFSNMLLDEMLIEIIAGETTPLYRELYRQGLINNGLAGETMAGRDCICTLFSGESKDPERVYQLLCREIGRIKEEGIPLELFVRTKKLTYGRYLGLYSKPESIASVLTNTYFVGMTLYDLLDQVAQVTLEQLEQRLGQTLDPAYSALSVVRSGQSPEQHQDQR